MPAHLRGADSEEVAGTACAQPGPLTTDTGDTGTG